MGPLILVQNRSQSRSVTTEGEEFRLSLKSSLSTELVCHTSHPGLGVQSLKFF